MITAEAVGVEQRTMHSRVLVVLPLVAVITLLPGMFYTTVVTSFILWTSSEKGQPWGLGLPLPIAVACGAAVALVFAAYVLRRRS